MEPIRFPGLGLQFTIDRVAFSLWGISIYWYGIIIGIVFALSLLLALKDSNKYSITQNDIIDLILYTLPFAIIGARLYYVIFSWSDYKNNLISIFNIHNGGLAIYGGILTALIVAFIFARKRKLDILICSIS